MVHRFGRTLRGWYSRPKLHLLLLLLHLAEDVVSKATGCYCAQTRNTISPSTLRSNLKLRNWTSVALMRIQWLHSGDNSWTNGTRTMSKRKDDGTNVRAANEANTQSTKLPKAMQRRWRRRRRVKVLAAKVTTTTNDNGTSKPVVALFLSLLLQRPLLQGFLWRCLTIWGGERLIPLIK